MNLKKKNKSASTGPGTKRLFFSFLLSSHVKASFFLQRNMIYKFQTTKAKIRENVYFCKNYLPTNMILGTNGNKNNFKKNQKLDLQNKNKKCSLITGTIKCQDQPSINVTDSIIQRLNAKWYTSKAIIHLQVSKRNRFRTTETE